MIRRYFMLFIVYLCLSLSGTLLAQEADIEGSKDHPLLNRMPGFYISQYEAKDFDAHIFLVNTKEVSVEGRYYYILYSIQPNAKEPSRIQVLSNYENAFKKIGGTVLNRDDESNSCMKLAKGGKEFWVHFNDIILL